MDIKKEIKTQQCKCCLRTSNLQNLWSDYLTNGERENYGEMIVKCFALPWEPPQDEASDDQQHICEACIVRLRDAHNFREQLLLSEQLLRSLEDGFKVVVESSETTHYLEVDTSQDEYLFIKYEGDEASQNDSDEASQHDDNDEASQNEDNDQNCYMDYDEEEMSADNSNQEVTNEEREFEDVEYLDDEAAVADDMIIVKTPQGPTNYYYPKQVSQEQDSPVISKQRKKKNKKEATRMNRQYTGTQLKECIEAVMEGMPIGEASIQFNVPKSTISQKISSINRTYDETGKAAIELATGNRPQQKFMDDIRIVLKYTNATPFKSLRYSQYSCAYCDEKTSTSIQWEALKVHIRTQHPGERLDIDLILRPYFANEIIKVDITDFRCIVCPMKLESWNGMFIHLKTVHDIELDDAYTKIIPFVLTDYKCALCNVQMGNHMQLDSHMNAHYNNYMCEECGETFLSEQRLKNHLHIHSTGSFPCTLCGKVFALENYMRKHFKYVHTSKAFQCKYCKEVFPGDYQRHLHVLEKHKERVKIIQCELCDKKFHWRPYYYKHMRFKHKRSLTENYTEDNV